MHIIFQKLDCLPFENCQSITDDYVDAAKIRVIFIDGCLEEYYKYKYM